MPKKPKIVIYTPVGGTPATAKVSLGYHNAVCGLLKNVDLEWLDSREYVNSSELARYRSRAVATFLERSSATHLLAWDEDVVASPTQIFTCIQGMLQSGFDLVSTPYPKKTIRWKRVAELAQQLVASGEAITAESLEAIAYEYDYMLKGQTPGATKEVFVENGCVEVTAVGGGFTLMSRECAEMMVDHYMPTLGFNDFVAGSIRKTAALYLQYIEDGLLLSEDYAFCARWAALGGRSMMYIADGSPLTHVGSYTFKGRPVVDAAAKAGGHA
jgi:hypothetical protein